MKFKRFCLVLATVLTISSVAPTSAFASEISSINDGNASYQIDVKTDKSNYDTDSATISFRPILADYIREHTSVTCIGKTVISITFGDNTEKTYAIELDAGKYKFKISDFPKEGDYHVVQKTTYIWGKENIKTVETYKYKISALDLNNPTDDFSTLKLEQTDDKGMNEEFSYSYNEDKVDNMEQETTNKAEEIVQDKFNEENKNNSNNNTNSSTDTSVDSTLPNGNGTYIGTEVDLDNKDNTATDVVKTVAKPSVKATLNNKVLSVKVSTKDKTRTGIEYRICYKSGNKVFKVTDKKTKKLNFKVKNVKKNNVYFIQTRTYTTKNGKTTYSGWSAKKYFIQQVNVGKKAKNTVKWQKINGAKSYTLYASTKKNGKYYKIKTTKGTFAKVTKINKKNFKTAYVKVVVNGTNGTKSTSKIYKLK